MKNQNSQLAWLIGALLFAAFGKLAAQEEPAIFLTNWRTAGNAVLVDSSEGAILLPAGSELSREYTATLLALRIVSRPYFGAAATDWASLGIGPASLSFIRDGKGGGLVLLGDKPLSLPYVIEIGEDGRSRQPLDIIFSYDRLDGMAQLDLDGQRFNVAAPSPGNISEAIVSSGSLSAWSIQTLEVFTGTEAQGEVVLSVTGQVAPRAKEITQSMADAANQRSELLKAMLAGRMTPAQAFDELRKGPRTLTRIDAKLDLGLAAVSLGEDLLAVGKFAESEVLFGFAETALLSSRTILAPDWEEALRLKSIARIRGSYLRKAEEAKADIEAAFRLNPRDKSLNNLRAKLTGQKPAL